MSWDVPARTFSRRALFGGLLDRGARPEELPRVARVLPAACIAFRGTLCTSCVERCPEPGALLWELGRPRVVDERCTGCGDCLAVCPAPTPALRLVPSPT